MREKGQVWRVARELYVAPLSFAGCENSIRIEIFPWGWPSKYRTWKRLVGKIHFENAWGIFPYNFPHYTFIRIKSSHTFPLISQNDTHRYCDILRALRLYESIFLPRSFWNAISCLFSRICSGLSSIFPEMYELRSSAVPSMSLLILFAFHPFLLLGRARSDLCFPPISRDWFTTARNL